MGLADKIADIIRPRPAGLFSTPAPAPSPAVHEALSSTSILSAAASDIAREGVRAFIRALEPRLVVSWGGVPLRGFAEGEYLSIDSATIPAPPVSVTCRIEGGMPTPEEARAGKEIRDIIEKVFHEKLADELARGVRDAKLDVVY